MKAAVLTGSGIEVRDAPKPKPAANQVLVRVRAAGLNRADLIMASGHMHGSAGGPGTVLGLEFAGEVEAVGSEVKGIKAGDRVMCSGNGGYAEYAVTDWGRVSAIPANNMGYEQAATLPIALQTMHNAIIDRRPAEGGRDGADPRRQLRRRPHGAADCQAQGRAAGDGHVDERQAARAAQGVRRRSRRRHHARAWADAVLAATDGKGVDLIVDQVSASVANENLRAAAVLGRIVNVGRLGGFKGEFDFDLHAMKRIDYIGVTFRTRSVEEVREIVRRTRADLWGDVESGALRLPIDRTFPLDQAAAALAHMRANAHFGKIVLVI